MKSDLELELAPSPESVPEARRALDALSGRIAESVLERVRLMLSELVTNAIRHAGLGPADQISVRLFAIDDRMRVEVIDRGAGFDTRPNAISLHEQSGWGLYLVGQLSDRWGVIVENGSCFWFEVDGSTATD